MAAGNSPGIFGFEPRSVPGCVLWLDGADSNTLFSDFGGTTLVGSSGNVGMWKDKSVMSNNYNQTTISGYRPTFANNTVSTSGNQFLSQPTASPFPPARGYDVFFVGKPSTSTASYRTLLRGLNTDHIIIIESGNYRFGTFYNGTVGFQQFGSLTMDGSARVLFSLTISTGGVESASVNGTFTQSVAGSVVNSGADFYALGNYQGGGQAWGDMNEIIIISNTTVSQRRQIEGYLAHKWGLRASLPGTHPFALVPPFARAFQPIDIPGLSLWLDGRDQSSMTFSGSNVILWNDKSGNGSHAITLSTGPTYSQTGLVFNSTPMRSSKTVTNNASFSIFSVVNASPPAPTTNYAVCGAWKNLYGSFGHFFTSSPSIRGNVSTGTGYAQAIGTTTGLPASSGTIMGLVINGDTTSSSGTTSINGTTIVSNVAGPNYAGQDEFFGIGCLFENGITTYPLASTTISEIIAFKVALTTSQRQQIEGYLAWKWGLSSSVPSIHPFYRLPATTTTSYIPLILYSQVGPFHWNTTWSIYVNGLTAANSGATVTTSSFSYSAPGGTIYSSGVLAPNGKIYCVPYSATTVLVIDPSNNTTTTFGSTPGNAAYIGGVLAPNGKIYCMPANTTNVLVIDPSNNTTSTFTAGSGNFAYGGGVLAPNGKIYCAPNNATSILVIDPSNNTTTTFGSSPGNSSYFGGVLAPNGKIYFVPRAATTFLVVDPSNNTATTFGSGTGCAGGVLAPNGKIYCVPSNGSNILVIDPFNNTTTTIGAVGGYFGGVLAPNGKIYCVPLGATTILVIDPTNNTTSTFGSVTGYFGGVLAPNGKIYFSPYGVSTIQHIVTGVDVDTQFALCPYFNKF